MLAFDLVPPSLKAKVRGKALRQMVSTSCAISFCLYGYDAGVLGGVQDTPQFRYAMGHPTGPWVIPMIASAYTLAATVCSLAVVMIGMPLGRRNCILLGNLFVVIGGALQASAWSVPHMIVGRIFAGIGIGFISCSIPTFQAELSAEPEQRGPDIAFTCVLLVSGAAIAYWIDFGFTRMQNQISWRFPIALQMLFAICAGSIVVCLPDTPRWYYAKGYQDAGDETLCRIFDATMDDHRVLSMKSAILASIELESSSNMKQFNLLDLIWDRSSLRAGRRIRISFLILAIQQMMGINLSVYFSTSIFAQIGLSAFMSHLLAALMNTAFALGSVPLIWTIERFGRRPILLWSAVALTICLAVFVAMIGQPNPTETTQWIAVAAIFIYNIIFGYGWIGVCWLYGPEIAPLKLRHAGAAAGAFGEWLFSFITVFAGGTALDRVGWKIWLWMTLSCFLATFFVYFMCPETTGKTLEEIDVLFARDDAKHDVSSDQIIAGSAEARLAKEKESADSAEHLEGQK